MTVKTALVSGAASRAMFRAPVGAFNPMLRGPMVAYASDDAGGAMTVDEAVAALGPSEPAEPAPEATEAATQEITSESSADDEPATEAENRGEVEAEGAQVERAATPLDPPLYWKPEAKEAFANLPPELQAVVLEQEGPREAAASKAKAEAAQVAKAAEHELASTQKLAQALGERLPQWVATFEQRWGTQTPDWRAIAQEHGVEAMTLAKLEFEGEAAQLQQAVQARQQADSIALDAWEKAEAAKLAELVPELADPVKGEQRKAEVASYLIGLGIAPTEMRHASAAHVAIARKAMLYDQAQAALKAAPNSKSTAPGIKAPVRPGAAAPQFSPEVKATATAKNRFVQTRSIDDAVAYLASKGL